MWLSTDHTSITVSAGVQLLLVLTDLKGFMVIGTLISYEAAEPHQCVNEYNTLFIEVQESGTPTQVGQVNRRPLDPT